METDEEGQRRRAHPSTSEWRELARIWSWSLRECDVIRLITTGVPRKRAAEMLGITLSTLQTHLRRASRKAGTEDLIALIWRIVDELDQLRAG